MITNTTSTPTFSIQRQQAASLARSPEYGEFVENLLTSESFQSGCTPEGKALANTVVDLSRSLPDSVLRHRLLQSTLDMLPGGITGTVGGALAQAVSSSLGSMFVTDKQEAGLARAVLPKLMQLGTPDQAERAQMLERMITNPGIPEKARDAMAVEGVKAFGGWNLA